MSLRKLRKGERDRLRSEFKHCQPLTNILNRMQRACPAPDQAWYIQDEYRAWSPSEDSAYREVSAGKFRGVARRLIIARRRRREKAEILAVIVLHWSLRGVGTLVPSHVGRTLLMEPAAFMERKAYLLRASYAFFVPVRGWGLLRCEAFPFAQQNRELYRCIDVSLWMGLDYLSRHLGIPRTHVGRLRSVGVRARNHFVPAGGLHTDEIMEVLIQGGLAPVHYQHPRDDSDPLSGLSAAQTSRDTRVLSRLLFNEMLHAYLDSQLPVFLILGRHPRRSATRNTAVVSARPHSVCVVGHSTYEPTPTFPGPRGEEQRDRLGCLTTTLYVDNFVIHDDDVGPYLLLPVHPQSTNTNEGPSHESVHGNAIGIFVGVPTEVRLPAETAFNIARTTLMNSDRWERRILSASRQLAAVDEAALADYQGWSGTVAARVHYSNSRHDVIRMLGHFLFHREDRALVLSLFLEHSSRFKQNVLTEPAFGAETRDAYLELALPKYVWIVELSTPPMLGSEDKRQVIGEVLLDASTGAAQQWAILAFRLPGIIFLRQRSGGIGVFESWCAPRVQWTVVNFTASRPT